MARTPHIELACVALLAAVVLFAVLSDASTCNPRSTESVTAEERESAKVPGGVVVQQERPSTPTARPLITDQQMDDALRLYRGLRLPEPPPGAELVLVGYEHPYPAFKTNKGIMWGTSTLPERLALDVRVLDPHSVDAYDADRAGYISIGRIPINRRLATGLHCWARGWKRLGRDLVSWSLKGIGEAEDQFMQPPCSGPSDVIPYLAWSYHGLRLANTSVPCADIAMEMSALLVRYENLYTPIRRQLVGALIVPVPLEAAGSPRARIRAAANSPDQHLSPQYNVDYPAPMQELIREGFDIIPAAISLLDDQAASRFFYTYTHSENWPPARFLTTGEYAALLLDAVSGHRLLDWNAPSLFLSREKAENWWKEAAAVGEKNYLSAALRQRVGHVYHEGAALALAQRHPEVLAEFYRNWVVPPVGPDEFLSELIAGSQLPVDVKRELFVSTLQSNHTWTRITALCQLFAVDKKLGVQKMRDELRAVPRPESEALDIWSESQSVYGPTYLRMLTSTGVDDSETWELLVATVRRLSPHSRARTFLATRNGKASRDHCIRFAAAFLDDESALNNFTDWDPSGVVAHCEWREQAVWLQAIRHLNALLGLNARLDGRSTPEEKEAVRALVRAKLKERGLKAFG